MIPTLVDECSEFLIESKGKFLLKNLPKTYEGFKKIKVRKKKNLKNAFAPSFNHTFNSYNDLLNRAIFVNSLEPENNDKEPFYIFPINGYRFMYNTQVNNIKLEYEDFFSKLNSWLNEDDSKKVFSDIIKNHFISDNLDYAIRSKCEILFYGINYYYAIRKSLIDDYKKFIYDI